jgi:hypothetical protein
MKTTECVLCQVGTEAVLKIQIEFMFQGDTVGCKIVSSFKKGDKNIWNSETMVRIPLGAKDFLFFIWGLPSLLFNGHPGSFPG